MKTVKKRDLLAFVAQVAGLEHSARLEHCDPDFGHDELIAERDQLIEKANELLGTTDVCDECGAEVPYVAGCPDGRELCQECFEAESP